MIAFQQDRLPIYGPIDNMGGDLWTISYGPQIRPFVYSPLWDSWKWGLIILHTDTMVLSEAENFSNKLMQLSSNKVMLFCF